MNKQRINIAPAPLNLGEFCPPFDSPAPNLQRILKKFDLNIGLNPACTHGLLDLSAVIFFIFPDDSGDINPQPTAANTGQKARTPPVNHVEEYNQGPHRHNI